MTKLVDIQNLNIRFTGERAGMRSTISRFPRRGEVLGLLGESGSGKA
jgi:ABC-type glutathione transport system ATPase component